MIHDSRAWFNTRLPLLCKLPHCRDGAKRKLEVFQSHVLMNTVFLPDIAWSHRAFPLEIKLWSMIPTARRTWTAQNNCFRWRTDSVLLELGPKQRNKNNQQSIYLYLSLFLINFCYLCLSSWCLLQMMILFLVNTMQWLLGSCCQFQLLLSLSK